MGIALLYGLAGGFLGSFIFVFLGITLTDIGIGYLWVVAIIGLLINFRFICFSYAGGIVSLSSIILGWPQVNVPSIIALVGVMHLLESILIRINGDDKPVPIIARHQEYGVIGGYIMQKLWPLPFVAMLAFSMTEVQGSAIDMPEWWPLIDTIIEVAPGEELVYFVFPVIAGLGYGDLSLAHTPEKRVKITSKKLFLYSLVLILLAVGSVYFSDLLLLAALASPVGHEIVIKKGRKEEKDNPPALKKPDQGILVLGVYPDYPADSFGLKRGDIITEVDNIEIDNVQQFYDLVEEKEEFKVNRKDKNPIHFKKGSNNSLGLFFLDEKKAVEMDEIFGRKGIIQKYYHKLSQKLFGTS